MAFPTFSANLALLAEENGWKITQAFDAPNSVYAAERLATGGASTSEVGEGSVLPATNAEGELFRLTNHATLPDGLYRWVEAVNNWIQV